MIDPNEDAIKALSHLSYTEIYARITHLEAALRNAEAHLSNTVALLEREARKLREAAHTANLVSDLRLSN